ncbi:MAG: carbon storage regulator CsrA [Phycisphaerales bacterium]|nr:carbon storage regulator CsrA [Phycisphaerales bacterium]
MLVLSRQRDETIMIGDEIEISIVDIRGDKVRLGINAPTRIAVHRKEVYDAIKRENTQAARLGTTDLDSLAQTIKPGPARREIREGARASSTSNNPAASLGATTVRPYSSVHSSSQDKNSA